MSPWKSRLRENLRGSSYPVFVFESGMISGANLWSGSRVFVNEFRGAGLVAGSRVILALPPGSPLLWTLLACLQEGLTVCPVPAHQNEESLQALAETYRADLVVCPGGDFALPDCKLRTELDTDLFYRNEAYEPTPDIRFLLGTSGTTGRRRIAALSDANVLAVMESHRHVLAYDDAALLSVLPWFHAFGLVLELLPALLARATVFRDPGSGDPAWLVSMLEENADPVTINMVPLTAARVLDRLPKGLDRATGLVGGAPVSAELAAQLSRTRLRTGYGQTEAAPGIAVGEPGEWEANYLGRPLGCRVNVAPDGELCFTGDNAFLGYWENGELTPRSEAVIRTGDIVTEREGRYYLRGRKNFSIKLANGRWFYPEAAEAELSRRLDGAKVLIQPADEGGLRLVVENPDTRTRLEGLRDSDDLPLADYLREIVVVAPGTLALDRKGMMVRRVKPPGPYSAPGL